MAANRCLSELEGKLAASPKFAETRLLFLFDELREVLDDLVHGVGGIEPAIVEVHKLYDLYIAPVDVPWVPNILEPALIDAPAKTLIGAIMRRLHERIHNEE